MSNKEYRRGTLVVAYGPMGASKTKFLIDNFIAGESIGFVPDIDTRSDGSFKTHMGLEQSEDVFTLNKENPEEMIDVIREVMNGGGIVRRVLIDEANFIAPGLFEVVDKFLEMNLEVFAGGLLLKTELVAFGSTRELAEKADVRVPLTSICDHGGCKTPAQLNYYKGDDATRNAIEVGKFDVYGCACDEHYPELREQYGSEPVDEITWNERLWEV